tara:strand:+ start:521 stop:2092 length:1572 start_codon:yes stop_codon:yes gene_type:complete
MSKDKDREARLNQISMSEKQRNKKAWDLYRNRQEASANIGQYSAIRTETKNQRLLREGPGTDIGDAYKEVIRQRDEEIMRKAAFGDKLPVTDYEKPFANLTPSEYDQIVKDMSPKEREAFRKRKDVNIIKPPPEPRRLKDRITGVDPATQKAIKGDTPEVEITQHENREKLYLRQSKQAKELEAAVKAGQIKGVAGEWWDERMRTLTTEDEYLLKEGVANKRFLTPPWMTLYKELNLSEYAGDTPVGFSTYRPKLRMSDTRLGDRESGGLTRRTVTKEQIQNYLREEGKKEGVQEAVSGRQSNKAKYEQGKTRLASIRKELTKLEKEQRKATGSTIFLLDEKMDKLNSEANEIRAANAQYEERIGETKKGKAKKAKKPVETKPPPRTEEQQRKRKERFEKAARRTGKIRGLGIIGQILGGATVAGITYGQTKDAKAAASEGIKALIDSSTPVADATLTGNLSRYSREDLEDISQGRMTQRDFEYETDPDRYVGPVEEDTYIEERLRPTGRLPKRGSPTFMSVE